MSEPQTTLTYESVLDLIQKSTQEAAKEAARQREEWAVGYCVVPSPLRRSARCACADTVPRRTNRRKSM